MFGLIWLGASVVVLGGLIVLFLRDEEEFNLLKPMLLLFAVGFVMLLITAVLKPVVGEEVAVWIAVPGVAAALAFLLVKFCGATLRQAALIVGLFFAFQVLWSLLWLIRV